MKRFIDLAESTPAEIAELIQLAGRLDRNPEPHALTGKVLGMLFFNPSLRTVASFQAAMGRLGGSSFVITPGTGTWKLESRNGIVMDGEAAEHIREAVPVLAGYADAIGIRAFAGGIDLEADLEERKFMEMAGLCPAPLINLESAVNHPCQALADWKTMDDLEVPARGGRFVLSWANHPNPLPLAVPSAAVHMAAMRGMEVTVLRPDGYALPEAVMQRAQAAAEATGGSVRETENREEALDGAHVVYAKSWASTRYYGRPADDRALRGKLEDWMVRESWFANAAREAIFMHCLPARRNVVVADEILDGPRSRVLPQARNRMTVQMAILHHLLAGRAE
ncbi:MAG TPA: N-acetylornithine carbamoyltransferase [Gammaproteobacteria bacterium]|nr:N-acetylornithine carbamoyltransferase [Gammaproteobacteria bacterium]